MPKKRQKQKKAKKPDEDEEMEELLAEIRGRPSLTPKIRAGLIATSGILERLERIATSEYDRASEEDYESLEDRRAAMVPVRNVLDLVHGAHKILRTAMRIVGQDG